MHVRIGVTYSPREIEIEMPDDADPEAVRSAVEQSMSNGGMLWLTDRKGHNVGVAVDKLTFNADGSIQKVVPTSGLSF